MCTKFLNLLRDEDGQDLIEYALLGVLIAVVVAGTLPALATAIDGEFSTIVGAF